MNVNDKVQLIKGIVVFSILFSVTYFFTNRYNENIKDDIENNLFKTVAKVYEVRYGGARNRSYKYKFKYNDDFYFGGVPIDDNGPNFKLVNKYFVLHMSTEHPDKNIIFLDKEVTDSVSIKKLEF